MLSRIRESLTLILIALLPLHAFAVTVLTKVFAGSESAPITFLATWKEVLLLGVVLVAILEIVAAVSGWQLASSGKATRDPLPATRFFDALDVLIILALLYSILIHPWGEIGATTSFIFGFRYDFVPLLAFFVLRRVSWSSAFLTRAFTILLSVGAIVAGYGLLTLVFPDSVFALLGYSSMHSLYISDGPIAAFQQISETGVRRIQSTFSGPNQFGLWLLIPLSIILSQWKGTRVVSGQWLVASFLLITLALLLTFSRSAWISAILIGILMLGPIVRRRVLTLGTVIVLVLGITAAVMLPHIVVRTLSTSAHVTRPLAAMQLIGQHPFGLGLGSAGPASNRTSDTCVELPVGSDVSWAEPHQNLCVFVGGTQVQPELPCNCPVIPENWYLQWGVEFGFFGFFISVFLALIVTWKLIIDNGKLIMKNPKDSIAAAFVGVSVAGLFLHSFEDSAVSYTLWILLSATLPLWKRQKAPSSS